MSPNKPRSALYRPPAARAELRRRVVPQEHARHREGEAAPDERVHGDAPAEARAHARLVREPQAHQAGRQRHEASNAQSAAQHRH
eukprot:CAMPEP_0185378774 /NCGR_PEP_ID=MMETSP1364-20130426/46084_1 /TAXON_ID=38817 /ORGANISM="Gephyrocapsa oceanica, Strain RCC1303" /LENGTH=84 /DNA_ID=CAMNT_0027980323 /DNA_START=26 /DNA_END=280 /DNA_ORIENTATION=+